MKKVISLVLAAVLCCALFAGCNSTVTGTQSSSTPSSQSSSKADESSKDTQSKLSGKLTMTGSTSMADLCNAMGEAFAEKYPDVTVEKGGTGSGEAVPAVTQGTALLGDLSRALKDEENPDDFTAVTLCLDGIGVVVNKDSKVSNLTKEQITKIFTGEITNWSEVGGDDGAITVVGREAASGTRDGFESIFGVKEKAKYALELQETGLVVSKVASDKNSIGYVSLASVNEEKGIKAVDVDGVKATEENVANGTYTVQRPFVQIYKKGSTDPLIKAWFEFMASDEGQSIIKDKGLVPQEIKLS